MTLAAADLLVAVVAYRAAHLGGLDALGVDANGAGGRLPARLGADLAAQGVEDLLPGAVLAPGDEVVPHRALGQQVVRQVVPLAARPRLVEQRVDHLAHLHRPRPTAPPRRRDQWLDQCPLLVGHIGAIPLPHCRNPAAWPPGVTPSLLSFLRAAALSG